MLVKISKLPSNSSYSHNIIITITIKICYVSSLAKMRIWGTVSQSVARLRAVTYPDFESQRKRVIVRHKKGWKNFEHSSTIGRRFHSLWQQYGKHMSYTYCRSTSMLSHKTCAQRLQVVERDTRRD